MVVVYGGHGERGPEGRVVTFVRPFVAAMPIFDEAMARDLEMGDDGVREMHREPLGVAEQTLFRFERGVSRGLESDGLELGPDFVAEAVGGGEQHDAGQGVGAGLVLGGGHRRRGGIGVGDSTSGGRLGVGTSHDKLDVGTDAELDGGSRRQGGLGVGASPGTGLVPTVCDG